MGRRAELPRDLFGKSSENITASPRRRGGFVLTSNALAASASSRLWYQTFDVEVGYHPPAWLAENVRLFFGPRILTAHSGINYDFNNSGTDYWRRWDVRQAWQFFARHRSCRHRPRAGFEASVPLAFTTAPVTFDISGAGSAIFTTVKDDYSYFSTAVTGSARSPAERTASIIPSSMASKAKPASLIT